MDSMALLVNLGLSIVFLLGILFGALDKDGEKVERISLSVAFGAMLSVALFDIIPEITEGVQNGEIELWKASFFVFLGFLVLFVLDRFVPEHEGSEKTREGNLVHIGIMATLAVAIHNIVEGMSVYSLARSSLRAGILLALGVALHNIPMGMLIYSTTKSEKTAKRTVIILISSFSTFIGGIVMALLESVVTDSIVEILSSLTLGMVIYILFLELLGDIIHGGKKIQSLIWIMVGLILVIVGGFFE